MRLFGREFTHKKMVSQLFLQPVSTGSSSGSWVRRDLPILPRTTDVNEIWPQLLMKALLKVYSYKWYAANCQYDSEVGDGSLVYSLTGLIPEKV
jgi:hypothetical protein